MNDDTLSLQDAAVPELQLTSTLIEPATVVVKVGNLVIRADRQASGPSTRVFLDGKPVHVRRIQLAWDEHSEWLVEMDYFPGQVPEKQ